MLPLHTLRERKPNKLQVRIHRGAFPGWEKNRQAPELGRWLCALPATAGAPHGPWYACAGEGAGTPKVHCQARVTNATPAA